VFFFIGLTLSILGAIPIIRFLFFYFTGNGDGHLQSLVLGGVLTILGFISFLIALLADLMNFNRQLIEQTLEKVRRIELQQNEEKKQKDIENLRE
jgi:multisubunit Na+/H+ antiporter MnhG subunit